ncbi:Ig-like domain-containing protein [Aquabacterium sp. J223]|uniref:Ig-like domain-containing protein n=1 Tax=Aquabacterium sp. J223 TaxID=2898431 RepID=UPI0021AD7111|nr:Ig-like domain-containing protein [Aquabacterium sp. J223]UUX94909.1 Ig-like domain-containing protein [Aquabacterium sp. J223]
MRRAVHPLSLSLAAVAAAALVACGGGGDAPPAAAATTVLVSGTAATGAAFTGATVQVLDADAAVLGSATVGTDGRWQVTVPADAKVPLVVLATRSADSGETDTLVSVLDRLSGPATLNVTPVTTLIAARLSPSGNPAQLAGEIKAGTATVNGTTLQSKVAEVQALIKPLLDATATAAVDPLSGDFRTDGTGYDRLLDSLLVTITPAGATEANIEIGLKVQGTDQPPVIRFSSTQPIDAIKADNQAVLAAPIAASALVAEGTNAKIQALLTRLTACYALPKATRVGNGTMAADVVAPACRTLFVNDDPATYRSNGGVVGAGQAWGGLFVEGATGALFSQGSYEFTRNNAEKDIVVAYKWRVPGGAEAFETAVVREQGGQFKLIGNQYVYPGSITAFHQVRRFATLDQSAFNYFSTGYSMSVTNRTASGVPIFDRVVVTAPNGATFTLRPNAGSGFLGLVKNGSTVVTNVVRLRAAYESAATTGNPADKDGNNLVFAAPAFTEEQIAAIPAQAVWTYTYYLASDPSQVAAVQRYTSRSRAMTIAEFKAQPLARFNAATLAGLASSANAQGTVPLAGTTPFGPLTWEMPTGALAPTDVTLFGVRTQSGQPNASFNDSAAVASTARSTSVNCVPASNADAHCANGGPGFASSTFGTGVRLLSTDSRGRQFDVHYATYRLP